MDKAKAVILTGSLSLCVVIITIFAMSADQVEALKKAEATQIAERQLLQMVVNASRHYWENTPITQGVVWLYPDADLDTSVYCYTYNAEYFAIIATAKDFSLVPAGKGKIAYFIKTGLPVKYKYDWLK